MSAAQQQPFPFLDCWLNAATKELSPAAQERIRLEIMAHFADAVEAHCLEGMPVPEARAQAVLDLGPANKAEKQFRKEHLTEWDVKQIKIRLCLRQAPTPVRVTFILVEHATLIGILIFGLHRFTHHRAVLVAFLCATIANLALIPSYYFVLRPANPRPNLSTLFWLAFLSDVSWSILFCLMAVSISGPPGLFFGLLPFYRGYIELVVFEFPLWLKLRKMDDVWQEMPPAAT